MLDQKIFGEKLRGHRKNLGLTQEEAASKIGVSAQAISKWEAGDCLPDCFNLKTISEVYGLSADVLLETEHSGDINSVSEKIEQIGTEFIWSKSLSGGYDGCLHRELGEDLLQMWKGLYFAEVGDRKRQAEDKKHGNLRICGPFGQKIWDDDGIVCIVKNELINKLGTFSDESAEVAAALCTDDGQRLIASLKCHQPTPKKEISEKTGIAPQRLNELLLMFTESRVIEYVSDKRVSNRSGYKICGHCGIAAYMILSAMYILGKPKYTVSEYLYNDIADP